MAESELEAALAHRRAQLPPEAQFVSPIAPETAAMLDRLETALALPPAPDAQLPLFAWEVFEGNSEFAIETPRSVSKGERVSASLKTELDALLDLRHEGDRPAIFFEAFDRDVVTSERGGKTLRLSLPPLPMIPHDVVMDFVDTQMRRPLPRLPPIKRPTPRPTPSPPSPDSPPPRLPLISTLPLAAADVHYGRTLGDPSLPVLNDLAALGELIRAASGAPGGFLAVRRDYRIVAEARARFNALGDTVTWMVMERATRVGTELLRLEVLSSQTAFKHPVHAATATFLADFVRSSVGSLLDAERRFVASSHDDGLSIAAVADAIAPIGERVHVIAGVVGCDHGRVTWRPTLPDGAVLLGDVHRAAVLLECDREMGALLLSLLRAALRPVLTHTGHWLQSGIIARDFFIAKADGDEGHWRGDVVLRPDGFLPPFWSELAPDILRCGKSMRLLLAMGVSDPPRLGFLLKRLLLNEELDEVPLATNQDDDAMAMDLLLQRAYVAPVARHIASVDERLMNELRRGGLDIHFRAIRGLYLLGSGTLSDRLSIFLVERLLNDGSGNAGALSTRLVLAAAIDEAKTELGLSSIGQIGLTLDPATANSLRDLIDRLSLTFAPRFPYSLLFTAPLLAQLNAVFRLLLRLALTARALQRASFEDHFARKGKESASVAGKMRFVLMQWVMPLQAYLFECAVGVLWDDFTTRLPKAKNVDELADLVERFGSVLIFRCILSERAEPLARQFRILLRLSLRLSIFSSRPNDASESERLALDMQRMSTVTAGMVELVRALLARGYQADLRSLLIRWGVA